MEVNDISILESVTIQPATIKDLIPLRQLEHACFTLDAWPLLDLIGVLTLPEVIRLKAVQVDKMVGFIAADIRRKKGIAWIATISVHPEYHQMGIGSLLLQACEKEIPLSTIRLSVRISNKNAINLYRKFGYQEIDIWNNYYKKGEDALIMEKRKK